MNVWLYSVLMEEPLLSGFAADCFKLFDNLHRDENQTYRLAADRDRNLMGKMLVAFAVKQSGRSFDGLSHWKTDLFKRPLLESDFDFNITHSGNLVACAFCERPQSLSDQKTSEYAALPGNAPVNNRDSGKSGIFPAPLLGFDVEEWRSVHFDLLHNYMTEAEWALIKNARHPNALFLDYWTAKESVMKASGKGMYLPVEAIEIKRDSAFTAGVQWQLSRTGIQAGYSDCLATAFQTNHIAHQRCSPEQLKELLEAV